MAEKGLFVLYPDPSLSCRILVLNATNTPGSDGYYRVHNSGPIPMTVHLGGEQTTHYPIAPGCSFDVWKGLGDDLHVHFDHEKGVIASGWFDRL